MVIIEPNDRQLSFSPARPVRASQRDERDAASALTPDVATEGPSFSAIMASVGSDWGASLGLRSVESELNGQMFEPVPRDARSAQKAQAKQELAADDVRDTRVWSTGEGQEEANQAQASGAHPLDDRSGEVSTDTSGATRSGLYGSNETGPQTSGHGAAENSRLGQGAFARDAAASATAPQPTHQPQSATGIAPGTVASAGPTAPVSGVARASTTTGSGNTNTAQQFARVLQTGSIGESASARAVSSSQNTHPASNRNQAGSEQVRAENPVRSSDPTVSAKEATRASEPTPFDELVRSIRLRARPDFSSARIRLDPPELGHVRVDVRLGSDRLELNVQTESPEAAHRVQSRVEELQAALRLHGIRVDTADVRVEWIDSANPGDPAWGATGGTLYEQNDNMQPHREKESRRSDAVHNPGGSDAVSLELDAGLFWNRATWSGVGNGRVDVRV